MTEKINQLYQERCPDDDSLMYVFKIRVYRDDRLPFHSTPNIVALWHCPECNSTQQTTITYLEVAMMD